MTKNIKKALIKNKCNVNTLIEKLKKLYVNDYKKIPLFDEDEFDKKETIESLWHKLSAYWEIYDYDLLIYFVKICSCEEATKIFEKFVSRIDSSIIVNKNLVLHYKLHAYKKEDVSRETLRVKVNANSCDPFLRDQVKESLFHVYDIHANRCALHLKTITKGCIEMRFIASRSLLSHIQKCEVYGRDLVRIAALGISSIRIYDMELKVPPAVQDMVG